MVHAISRHYSQPERMAHFLQRIASQLIARSRQALAAGGKLWEQPKPALIARLEASERLHAAFMVSGWPGWRSEAGRILWCHAGHAPADTPPAGTHCSHAQGRLVSCSLSIDLGMCGHAECRRCIINTRFEPPLQAQAADFLAATGGAALDPAALFPKYDQFNKRCQKLAGMYSTVHQFAELGQHTHIEGMGAIMAKFAEVLQGWGLLLAVVEAGRQCFSFARYRSKLCLRLVGHRPCPASPLRQAPLAPVCPHRLQVLDDIKKKPYDLLDFGRSEFDRDLLEFNVNIHDLEATLQVRAGAGAQAHCMCWWVVRWPAEHTVPGMRLS